MISPQAVILPMARGQVTARELVQPETTLGGYSSTAVGHTGFPPELQDIKPSAGCSVV